MRKIEPQLKCSSRTPESNGPTAPPAPFAPDHKAKATVRSFGSENSDETSASVEGANRAAPTPIRARALISRPVVPTSPAIREKLPKTAVPTRNVRDLPQRSTSPPATSSRPA